MQSKKNLPVRNFRSWHYIDAFQKRLHSNTKEDEEEEGFCLKQRESNGTMPICRCFQSCSGFHRWKYIEVSDPIIFFNSAPEFLRSSSKTWESAKKKKMMRRKSPHCQEPYVSIGHILLLLLRLFSLHFFDWKTNIEGIWVRTRPERPLVGRRIKSVPSEHRIISSLKTYANETVIQVLCHHENEHCVRFLPNDFCSRRLLSESPSFFIPSSIAIKHLATFALSVIRWS